MSAVVRLAAAVARQVCDDESDEAEEMRSLATAARREYDRLRAEVADLLPEADAKQHFATRALRAEERLQWLRRELEALRARLLADMPGNWDAAAGDCCPGCYAGWDAAIEGIGAILRGES